MKLEKLIFVASLPPIASAIQISGLGDGATIKLELSAKEMYSIVQLPLYAQKYFKVTIEEIEDKKYGKSKAKTDST